MTNSLGLFDLADTKGYDVTQSTMRDHVRLIDPDGNLVKNQNGGAGFSYAEARRFSGGVAGQELVGTANDQSAGLPRLLAYERFYLFSLSIRSGRQK